MSSNSIAMNDASAAVAVAAAGADDAGTEEAEAAVGRAEALAAADAGADEAGETLAAEGCDFWGPGTARGGWPDAICLFSVDTH